MRTSNCCVVFSKPARAGRVKTRLIGALTADEAADLHQAFLDDLLTRLTGREFGLEIAWALADDEAMPESDVPAFRQQGGDLGERLHHGLRHVGRRYGQVAALGSDHPEIPVSVVDQAFDRLDSHDAVVGPATDGGYYLIAFAADRLRPELFAGIAWSTDRVLAQTLERCATAGLDVSLLPEGSDVDSPDDLRRLSDFLSHEVHDCEQTESLFRQWGMLR